MHMSLLHAMFNLEPSVAEKILRPILVYAFLIVGLRLAGKRELAQLNPFDLVLLLTISNTVQNAIIGDDNSLTGGVIGAATLLAMNYLVAWASYKSPRLEKLVEGDSTLLIDNGVLQHSHLEAELVTHTELETAAHKEGFESLDEIDCAILDPGGSIAFFAKEPTTQTLRYEEIMKRLDQISAQLAALRA
jgi:uncharacterized membrane protein YcaP (DUF421 family)